MKRLLKKTKGLIQGVPSAVLLSALIHLVLLSIAGGLVVFSVIRKPEKKFVPPPPVERPKMVLKKPKVKVKKTSAPPASNPIISKNIQSMPDLQLPDVSGISGSGFGGGGLGGFELMPDVSEMSLFGGGKSVSVGNDFEGTLYSLYYDRRGRETGMDEVQFISTINDFMESGWNPMIFTPYFRAPKKLYTTQIFVPAISSEFGPSHFGVPISKEFDAKMWLVHYKGKICRPQGGRFRFRGMGDDILLVRVNGKLVFNACWGRIRDEFGDWRADSDEDKKYLMGHSQCLVGHWFDLPPGVPVEMEVLLGENGGGYFAAYLVVEQKGDIYAENSEGMPILPVFKTAEISEPIKDKIKYTLIRGEADLDSELMFNVY
jgi:hypothetical protein